MTALDLAAIRARAEADVAEAEAENAFRDEGCEWWNALADWSLADRGADKREATRAIDALILARARDTLTLALCAEVERQAAEIARLREELRRIADTRWDASAADACLVMIATDARAVLAEPRP